ncbi:MAG: hypothetical protein M1817_004175 [Caeruleum heppii]|nr:MAG: hypothetical protein M1817_004175 [Caeruleum heppii]
MSPSAAPLAQGVKMSIINSKATLRLPLQALLSLLPTVLHPHIKTSRYHTSKSDTIVIQADGSRKQAANVEECYERLHRMIIEAGQRAVPGETSQSKKTRVKGLQKADNEARLRLKKSHSSKKAARRGGAIDG